MTPVEDMTPGRCKWCHHTHPVDAECVTDREADRPTPEDTNGDTE